MFRGICLQAVLAAYSTSAGSQLHLRHFQWLTLAEWGGVLGLARQNSLQVRGGLFLFFY
jgi:hypothetical protein